MKYPNNDPDFYQCTAKGCSGKVSASGKKDLQGRVLFECEKCGRVTSDELLMSASTRQRLLD